MDRILADKLVLFFENYLSFYKEFLQLETDLFHSIISNRFESIDSLVQSEEAYLLRSRGLEIERDRLVSQTGSPKATYRELIPLFDSPQRENLESNYQELSQVLLELKAMNRRCGCSLELRLHRIHTAMEGLDKRSHPQTVYSPKTGGGGELSGILCKKI